MELSDKMNIDIDNQYVILQPFCHSDLVLRSLTFFLSTVVLKKTMFCLTENTVPLGYEDHCVNATREILATHCVNHNIDKNTQLWANFRVLNVKLSSVYVATWGLEKSMKDILFFVWDVIPQHWVIKQWRNWILISIERWDSCCLSVAGLLQNTLPHTRHWQHFDQ